MYWTLTGGLRFEDSDLEDNRSGQEDSHPLLRKEEPSGNLNPSRRRFPMWVDLEYTYPGPHDHEQAIELRTRLHFDRKKTVLGA